MKKPKIIKPNVVQKYKDACEDVAREFMAKYYPEHIYNEDSYWIAGQIGYLMEVSNDFINMERMIEAIELDCPVEKFHEYQEMETEHYIGGNSDKPLRINFKNYVKWGLIDK